MDFHFQPKLLEDVLARIRKEHPNRLGQDIEIGQSIIGQVTERIKLCPQDKLSELAYSFDLREINACLEILCKSGSDEIKDKSSKILLIRPRNQVIQKGWFKLVKMYPHELLESTLKNLIAIKKFKILLNHKKISPDITEWFMSDKLVNGLIKTYQKKDKVNNFDTYLSDNFIEYEHGLRRTAWRLFLCTCSSKSLKKELPKRIYDEYIDATNAAYLKKFCQHYLNTLPKISLWDEKIITLIYNRFGAPFASKKLIRMETTFWSKISEEATAQFNKWIMLHHIESFFEGERADFWKIFVQSDHVLKVKEILSGQGFLLEFGNFGIIEFKKVGNAAYVYPASVFKNYWNRNHLNEGRPEDYKDINATISIPGWNGRIIHRENWQVKTKKLINTLLGM
jgi:hypothetical protein